MKILLIMPNFFNYPRIICDKLNEMGHEVDYYDDRPSTNSFIKALIRMNRKFVTIIIKKYFNKIIREIESKKYHKVILISGQSLSFSTDMLERIKKIQNEAEFILYQWDSLKNFEYIKNFAPLFDRAYSFDYNDVLANKYLSFLPLFYSDDYKRIGEESKNNFLYDFLFVGTAHPKKYYYVKKMSKELNSKFKNQLIYFYFPSKLVYIYRKLFNKEFRKAKINEFTFESINSKKLTKLISNSRCILDSAQGNQNGLTIRVIETLGAKRKIITTNEDIINYNFYLPENIYVYDGKFDFSNVFFNSSYKELDSKIYNQYSLDNWLKILLNQGDANENISYRS